MQIARCQRDHLADLKNVLKDAYLLAKIGADTAENERNFAKNWQLPYGSTTLRARRALAARGGRAVGRQGRGAVGRGARRRRPRRREGRITSQIMANLLLNFARTCGNVSQIWQTCQTIYQILHGSVSAVSKPIFQSKNE